MTLASNPLHTTTINTSVAIHLTGQEFLIVRLVCRCIKTQQMSIGFHSSRFLALLMSLKSPIKIKPLKLPFQFHDRLPILKKPPLSTFYSSKHNS